MSLRTLRTLILCTAAVAPLASCGEDPAAKARDAEERAMLRADLEKTRKELERTSQSAQAAREDARNLRETVAALGERIAALEARPAAGSAAASAPGAVKPAPLPTDKKAALEEMKALQDKVFSGEATDDEQQRFWELARTAAVVDELMKQFEAKVKEHPDDVEARMQLGNAYISKLLSIPPGPEQGLWSNKAVQQWQAVLQKNPDHWDARYSLAFNWSMWPDFMNKTPDAIREFEKVREVQERQTPDAKHAQTYFQLSRLYQKQGKADKAKETLRAGLARFPEEPELRKALDSLEN